jgi:hypothetical protein
MTLSKAGMGRAFEAREIANRVSFLLTIHNVFFPNHLKALPTFLKILGMTEPPGL